MRCPVCGAENVYELNKCAICGTDNINPTFINKADAESWQEDMGFAKAVFFLEENNPSMKMFTEDFRREAPNRTIKQLDIYFGYNTLKEKLSKDPDDHITRSWMVDYLVQVYTFLNNYPVSSRRYVRQEIAQNTMALMAVRDTSESGRFKHTCNKAVLSLFNAEVELSDGNVAQALSHYYEFLTNPVVHQGILSLRANEDYIECDDDIKYVIHNCKELCKIFSLADEHQLAAIEDRLSSSMASTNEGSFYMHGMNCGIAGSNDSEESRIFLKGTKKDNCTLEQCSFKGMILQSGLDNFGVGCENAISTGFNENFDRTWSVEYRTLEFVLDDTITSQKHSIQSEINKILMLFGF